jgi:NADH dehydrogenase (ubiquinone) 1 alpha/beta subcomplex 1
MTLFHFLSSDLISNRTNEQVALDSHFIKDLGLDSLDAVEVIMAIEEEFSIEIPERDVDKILTPAQAVEFLEHHGTTH